MKSLKGLVGIGLLLVSLIGAAVVAQTTPDGYVATGVRVEESDGSPTVPHVQVIRVDAGALTDNNDGIVTLDLNLTDVSTLQTLASNLSTTQGVLYAAVYVIEPGYIVVGNASSNAAEVAMSGDATISSSGVVTAAGITTNFNVVTETGTTNALYFTNGLLRVKGAAL